LVGLSTSIPDLRPIERAIGRKSSIERIKRSGTTSTEGGVTKYRGFINNTEDKKGGGKQKNKLAWPKRKNITESLQPRILGLWPFLLCTQPA